MSPRVRTGSDSCDIPHNPKPTTLKLTIMPQCLIAHLCDMSVPSQGKCFWFLEVPHFSANACWMSAGKLTESQKYQRKEHLPWWDNYLHDLNDNQGSLEQYHKTSMVSIFQSVQKRTYYTNQGYDDFMCKRSFVEILYLLYVVHRFNFGLTCAIQVTEL